jgi:hypothetical protein
MYGPATAGGWAARPAALFLGALRYLRLEKKFPNPPCDPPLCPGEAMVPGVDMTENSSSVSVPLHTGARP